MHLVKYTCPFETWDCKCVVNCLINSCKYRSVWIGCEMVCIYKLKKILSVTRRKEKRKKRILSSSLSLLLLLSSASTFLLKKKKKVFLTPPQNQYEFDFKIKSNKSNSILTRNDWTKEVAPEGAAAIISASDSISSFVNTGLSLRFTAFNSSSAALLSSNSSVANLQLKQIDFNWFC